MRKTHKWRGVRGRRSEAVEAEFASRTRDMRQAMRLADLRKAGTLTQVALAETMGLPQGEISKIEHRQDVYLGTLRRFIEAMGGELVLAARFPDGELPIQIGE